MASIENNNNNLTRFCMHAKGTLEQVVQSAIQRGFTIYGLSEHMPRYRPDQLYPEESHLTTQDLERMYDQFLQEAVRLQQKYKDQICLLIGLETEYFGPESIEYVRNLRQPYRQTLFGPTDTSSSTTTATATATTLTTAGTVPPPITLPQALEKVGHGSWQVLFREYFDAQFQMLQGLQPEVVGHLDLVRIFFSAINGCHHHQGKDQNKSQEQHEQETARQNQNKLTPDLWELVRRNVDYVVGYGGLFELNSRAWKKGLADAYPQRDILEHILSKGGRITLSDDSHGPDDVGMFYNPNLKAYLER
ncbi:Polymerase/histidinol phosphatase-like protein [Lobosporangium transversale]|uniref:Histidinol-phosphatase n=1 Tax=Lobosporangium transversale TaxID=64571 RepID=A0A1Y2GAD0_9FUNG|nr:Polymerase/histidinol phosphatase-like protein [Lobosporangium transversale]ORZ05362.1 Polymerase/histidinol phosphatase-like protein [Lobosporangium transversale]|eukprot:XP_021877054.1 Polymerase/histidinol phosphatase-like protein [Lobosporangium transversale]